MTEKYYSDLLTHLFFSGEHSLISHLEAIIQKSTISPTECRMIKNLLVTEIKKGGEQKTKAFSAFKAIVAKPSVQQDSDFIKNMFMQIFDSNKLPIFLDFYIKSTNEENKALTDLMLDWVAQEDGEKGRKLLELHQSLDDPAMLCEHFLMSGQDKHKSIGVERYFQLPDNKKLEIKNKLVDLLEKADDSRTTTLLSVLECIDKKNEVGNKRPRNENSSDEKDPKKNRDSSSSPFWELKGHENEKTLPSPSSLPPSLGKNKE